MCLCENCGLLKESGQYSTLALNQCRPQRWLQFQGENGNSLSRTNQDVIGCRSSSTLLVHLLSFV